MKRTIAILLMLAMCISLSACKGAGKTSNAVIDYGTSTVFSEAEIKSSVDALLTKFKDFKGEELTKVWYDENKSASEVEQYMSNGRGSQNGVLQENVIILYSVITSNGNEREWKWILIRDSANDKWKVDDWGNIGL